MNKQEMVMVIQKEFLSSTPQIQAEIINSISGTPASNLIQMLFSNGTIEALGLLKDKERVLRIVQSSHFRKEHRELLVSKRKIAQLFFNILFRRKEGGVYLKYMSYQKRSTALIPLLESLEIKQTWRGFISRLEGKEIHEMSLRLQEFLDKPVLRWTIELLGSFSLSEKHRFYQEISVAHFKKILWICALYYDYVGDPAVQAEQEALLFGFDQDEKDEEDTKIVCGLMAQLEKAKLKELLDFLMENNQQDFLEAVIQSMQVSTLASLCRLKKYKWCLNYATSAQQVQLASTANVSVVDLLKGVDSEDLIDPRIVTTINSLPLADKIAVLV